MRTQCFENLASFTVFDAETPRWLFNYGDFRKIKLEFSF